MAKTLWGNVYFQDTYAGRLQQQPGGRVVFSYDAAYLDANQPAISYTLPLRLQPYVSERGLPPFFDNLVAEGWLRSAQARTLGVDPGNRFALLLGFGYDLAGAVSVIDPEPQTHHRLDHSDDATLAALLGRASISGVQRKLLVVKDGNRYRPVRPTELSTHIAKLSSGNLNELLELEYLTTAVIRALLPDDDVVDTEFTTIPTINEEALVIPRFDRSRKGKRLHHFEEFNQLLGHYSGDDKYEGSYEDMGQFILNTPDCMPVEADRLFRRILSCFLVGNTDAHFKNFAMLHTRNGLRLTPAYDLVATSVYPQYQSIALQVSGARNLAIGKLEPKHLLIMGERFGENGATVLDAVETLGKRLPQAFTTIEKSPVGSQPLRNQLQQRIQKRWNGTFALIGRYLSKKQNKGAKAKN